LKPTKLANESNLRLKNYSVTLRQDSTAGYFEMMQTLAAVCITWGFFHASLHPHQVIAAIVLIGAVAMVHRVQHQVEPAQHYD